MTDSLNPQENPAKDLPAVPASGSAGRWPWRVSGDRSVE